MRRTRSQDRTLARALYGGRGSMEEHLVVAQGVVGSRPTVRPPAVIGPAPETRARLARIRLTVLCQGGQVKMPSASLARPGSIPLGPWQHGYRQGVSIEKSLVQIQPLAHVGGQKCRKVFVWIKSYARVAQRQSSLHTICVPCPPGINSLMGRDSMVTEREGGWFESSPWRLESQFC